MSLISLTGIKYRSKSRSAKTIIGGFPDYATMDIAEAFASVLNPILKKSFLPNSALSTATGISPTFVIKPNSVAANSIAEALNHFILAGHPHPTITESIASITSPTILEQIPITITESIASISSPIVKIAVISEIALATASIVEPFIYIDPTIIIPPVSATASIVSPTLSVTTTATILQLSFPEETEYPLWAGNLSGQSFDDTMLVVIQEILTDAILLEDGTGGIELEDGTGIILLEDSGSPLASIGEEEIGG